MLKLSERKLELIFLSIALTIGLAMRLWEISAFSYSNDELSALYRLRFEGFGEIIRQGVIPDFHPAGVQVLLSWWTSLVGMSEFWVRLPFILSGVGSVLLIYLIGKKLYGSSSAMVSAALMAVLEFPVLYSRLARPYASGLFFILLATWFWVGFLRHKKLSDTRKKGLQMLGLAVSLSLCMYNHYFSFLAAAFLGLIGLLTVEKSMRTWFAAAGGIAVLLFLPHLPVSIAHFSIGGLSTWLGPPGLWWPVEHWTLIFNESIGASIIAAVVLLIVLFRPRRNTLLLSPGYLILLWLIPLLIGYFYSLWVNPVLQHSILLFSFPFLILALSSAFSQLKTLQAFFLAMFLLVGGALHTTFSRGFYQKLHFADFRNTVATLESQMEKRNSDDYLFVLNANSEWYYDFYASQELNFVMDDVRNMDSLRVLRHELEAAAAPGVAYISLKGDPPETFDLLHDMYPCLEFYEDLQQRSWLAILNKEEQNCIDDPGINWIYTDSLNFINDSIVPRHDSLQGFYMEPGRDFGPAIKGKIASFDLAEPTLLYARAVVNWLDGMGNPELVASVVSSTGRTRFWRSSQFRFFIDEGGEGVIHLYVKLGHDIRDSDELAVYIYNSNGGGLLVKDLSIRIK